MKRLWSIGMALAVSFMVVVSFADAAPKGKIVVGFAGEPSTFDPHRITGLPIVFQYPLVFDTLVFRDPAGKLVPRLATSWRLVSPKVWEFKLRKGVKFTNGEPVDARAVKFSLERIRKPELKSRQYSYFKTLDHVEVVDQHTARVHTKYPDMFLISPLATYGQIVPPKYYAKHDLKYLARHPVGSGPYKLVRWKKNEEIVYEANPSHWDPSKQRVKTAIVKIIPEPNTRVSALLAGDVQLIDVVPPQLVSMVKANSKVEVLSGQSPRTCLVSLIIKPGAPWADVRVRKALNYAVDKDSLIKNILQGHGKKVNVLQGPTSFGHNPNLKPYPYDPARAKKLLAEAGYPNGFSVDMYIPHGRFLMGEQASEAIGGMLAKVGVKVRVLKRKWGAVVKQMKARWEPRVKPFWWYTCRMDLHMHTEGMYAGFIHGKSTWGGFRDKGVDKLLAGARGETDPAKRKKKYQELNRIIYEEKVPLIFLYQVNQIHAKNKRVDWNLRTNGVIHVSEAGLKE